MYLFVLSCVINAVDSVGFSPPALSCNETELCRASVSYLKGQSQDTSCPLSHSSFFTVLAMHWNVCWLCLPHSFFISAAFLLCFMTICSFIHFHSSWHLCVFLPLPILSGTQIWMHLPVVFCRNSVCVCSPSQTLLSAPISMVCKCTHILSPHAELHAAQVQTL